MFPILTRSKTMTYLMAPGFSHEFYLEMLSKLWLDPFQFFKIGLVWLSFSFQSLYPLTSSVRNSWNRMFLLQDYRMPCVQSWWECDNLGSGRPWPGGPSGYLLYQPQGKSRQLQTLRSALVFVSYLLMGQNSKGKAKFITTETMWFLRV
jgi:hypothetical protein